MPGEQRDFARLLRGQHTPHKPARRSLGNDLIDANVGGTSRVGQIAGQANHRDSVINRGFDRAINLYLVTTHQDDATAFSGTTGNQLAETFSVELHIWHGIEAEMVLGIIPHRGAHLLFYLVAENR